MLSGARDDNFPLALNLLAYLIVVEYVWVKDGSELCDAVTSEATC